MKKILILFILAMVSNSAFAADTKLTALSADATPTTDDLLYTVDDPGGTPASKKATIANVFKRITYGPICVTSNTSVGADNYFAFGGGDASTTETNVDYARTGRAFTITRVMGFINNASGTGGSYSIFLKKNNSGTAVSVDLANVQSASADVSVAIGATDTLVWALDEIGTSNNTVGQGACYEYTVP